MLLVNDVIHTLVPMMTQSYLSLYHVRSVESQVKDATIDVHRVPAVQLLQHSIQDDEGPCATHTSTDTHTRLRSKNT